MDKIGAIICLCILLSYTVGSCFVGFIIQKIWPQLATGKPGSDIFGTGFCFMLALTAIGLFGYLIIFLIQRIGGI